MSESTAVSSTSVGIAGQRFVIDHEVGYLSLDVPGSVVLVEVRGQRDLRIEELVLPPATRRIDAGGVARVLRFTRQTLHSGSVGVARAVDEDAERGVLLRVVRDEHPVSSGDIVGLVDVVAIEVGLDMDPEVSRRHVGNVFVSETPVETDAIGESLVEPGPFLPVGHTLEPLARLGTRVLGIDPVVAVVQCTDLEVAEAILAHGHRDHPHRGAASADVA